MYFAVMSITPGPNNVMVTASGAAFGYRATLPHVLGVGMGAALQMVLVALGLGVAFQRFPILQTALALGGAAYLLYLAWQLFNAGTVAEAESRRPFTAAAVFVPRDTPISRLVMVVGGIFLIVNVPCVSVWALFGSGMRHLLLRPAYRRVFNVTMSVLLVLTAIAGLRG